VIHIFAFAGRASAFYTKVIAKNEITHSHEHQHEHGEIDHSKNNDHQNLPSQEHTHRHEILVGSQIPFIQSDICTSFLKIENLVIYSKFNQDPHQGPFLSGIFRPPIRA
jgi:hypothetical protein